MDKKQRVLSVGLVLCMLVVFALASQIINTEEKEEGKIAKPGLVERLTSLLFVSSPSSSNTPQTSGGNWDKLKAFVNQARTQFSPPNLDFRGSEENEPVSRHGGSSSTAGEKVREAVTTSLEKTKEAVEDSAKSAAKIAGQTAQTTTNKVKKTFSANPQAQDFEL